LTARFRAQTLRQKQIKEILDSKHTGKGGTPEQQKLRDQLQQLRTEWDTVLVRTARCKEAWMHRSPAAAVARAQHGPASATLPSQWVWGCMRFCRDQTLPA
jgi:hypothetical protein